MFLNHPLQSLVIVCTNTHDLGFPYISNDVMNKLNMAEQVNRGDGIREGELRYSNYN